MPDLEKLVDFFVEIESLKKTYRYSTCPENVRDSSADHSWKLAFMSSMLEKEIQGVDLYHSVQICLVHDLAEAITGDIDSYRIVLGEVTKEQKYEMEKDAMNKIREKVPDIGSKIYDLWQEFEDCKTPEAKYANAMDKIEALVHLLHVNYVAKEDNAEAELTATYADKSVKDFPQLQPLLDVVKSRLKKEYEQKGFQWKNHYD